MNNQIRSLNMNRGQPLVHQNMHDLELIERALELHEQKKKLLLELRGALIYRTVTREVSDGR